MWTLLNARHTYVPKAQLKLTQYRIAWLAKGSVKVFSLVLFVYCCSGRHLERECARTLFLHKCLHKCVKLRYDAIKCSREKESGNIVQIKRQAKWNRIAFILLNAEVSCLGRDELIQKLFLRLKVYVKHVVQNGEMTWR